MRTLAATLAIALFATACSMSSPCSTSASCAESDTASQRAAWASLRTDDGVTPWGEAPADEAPDDGSSDAEDDADDTDELLALVRSGLPIDRLDGADVHWHRLLVRFASDHHTADLIRPPIHA